MISWSRIAVVIKFAALAATHQLEPSGPGNKRITLAPEITTFEAALDSAKLRSKNARTGPREPLMQSAPVSCGQPALPVGW
jgi:hypothetical protein